MSSPVFKAALVKYACPVCGQVADEGIIVNSILTEEAAKEVEKLNGEIVGYAGKACEKCAKYKDEAIFFIGIDVEKSPEGNPYRTGQIVGVKKDADIIEYVKDYIIKLEDGTELCYIDENIGKTFGLW